MGKYLLNKETQKIELHFDKADYISLSDAEKKEIKSAFLWSNYSKAWVSRSTKNHYFAIKVAEKLGLENAGAIGERLTYAEELQRKTEKAEARAERYDQYSINAEKRAKQLQSALKSFRGDISFLTQPIIVGHAGSRAFANYREKLYKRYEKGFEEYQKSEYYQDRAATARATADNVKLKDKVYLHNRIKECNVNLKKYQDYIVTAENNLYKVQQGEQLKRCDGTIVTVEALEERIANLLEKYDYEENKLEFFEGCLSDLGGIEFSKSNIKVGYIVKIDRSGKCEIVSTGPVNVTYKILTGGASGMVLTTPYASIAEIIEAKEAKQGIENPYKVGDIVCNHRPADNSIYAAYQVVKTTKTGIKLQKIAVENDLPVKDKFVSAEVMQKKVTKSKYSDYIGVYINDWQTHLYRA